jgi:hypothetical protein
MLIMGYIPYTLAIAVYMRQNYYFIKEYFTKGLLIDHDR